MEINDGLGIIIDSQLGDCKVKLVPNQPFLLHIKYASLCFIASAQDSHGLAHAL